MKGFLTTERQRSFSDSVLLVGVVLLVHDPVTLATSELEFFFEPSVFFHAPLAFMCRFIAVFFTSYYLPYFWSLQRFYKMSLSHFSNIFDTSNDSNYAESIIMVCRLSVV